jgi:hypothetical protein
VSRVGRSEERILVETLAGLRRTLDDLKQVQTFGTSNFKVYWLHKDEVELQIQLAAGATACYEVTLIPKTSVSNPALALDFEVVNITGRSFVWNITPLEPVGGVQKWHVWFTTTFANSGMLVPAPVRFAFQSVSNATWDVRQIA